MSAGLEHAEACRACGGSRLLPILSLGRQPLANALLTMEQLAQPEASYPLDLAFCPSCALVQITHTVSPEALFREYLYLSSFSDTFLRHAEMLTNRLVDERRLGAGSLVMEAASNDGYLLQYYKQRGVPVLGIEPAQNVAEIARAQRAIPTLCEFFGVDVARQLCQRGQRADVLHAHNVLAHVADLNGFVAGIRLALKDEGLAVIEVPYVKEMIDRCEFDTIYHEHLCYFSLCALHRLFGRHGLFIERVERVAVHGGSLRLFASPRETHGDASVAELLEQENRWGVDQASSYQSFSHRVAELQASLRAQLRDLRAAGKRIAAYGAAAKGVVLLSSLALEPGVLEFVVDRSPHKQGRFLPGLHLAVCAPDALLREMPDYVLLLVWNLAEEVLEQQAEYRRRGGRFIIPVPSPKIV